MDAYTPQQLREAALADLVAVLAEADSVLEALAGNPHVGTAVQLLATELVNARQRLQRPLNRLRLALPPAGKPR